MEDGYRGRWRRWPECSERAALSPLPRKRAAMRRDAEFQRLVDPERASTKRRECRRLMRESASSRQG
jgi:hypothetical protein